MAHSPAPPHYAHEGDAIDRRGGGAMGISTIAGAAYAANADDGVDAFAVGRQPLAPHVHSARNEYPLNVAVDFTQLRANALRRYMAFHRIQEVPGSSQEQLAVAVARHFNEACQRADESASISSFVSYLRSNKEDAADEHDKENSRPRQQLQQAELVIDDDDEADDRDGDDDDSDLDMDDGAVRDGAYDYYPNQQEENQGDEDDREEDEDDERLEDDEYDEYPRSSTQRKRKPSSSESSDAKSSSNGKSGKSSNNSNNSKSSSNSKKKRKARVYCVCKGSSFGNMIACDNKKCLDRSNWYHMGCIGLDSSKDPPETWYCPTCQEQDPTEIPENQYRKPVASVTYGDMISHALAELPHGKGTFKEICDFVEKQYESQLNWKLESDQRKSPVWKSSVRKILFSNMRFRKHPDDKGLFCLAA